MANQNCFRYKDKKVVISVFNESQSHYKRYKELVSGNPVDAQKELNLAGNKVQQSFELGLKCYLNRKYKELYNAKTLKWRVCDRLVKIIENGSVNGRMVDVRYLMGQMDLYADPSPVSSGVDFELIRTNAKPINNDNKHQGNDIDVKKFEDSYSEIRKFILKYIDENPQIQMIQTPEYMNLQEACEYWEKNSKYNFCLICDRCKLDDAELRKILYINWSMIIDFDINTEYDGLLKAYTNEYGFQPNSFAISNPKNTVFDAASNLPYWFHINGVKDIQESIADTDRRWNQKYGAILSDCICKYRESFSKPLKVIILGGNAKRIEKILSVFDAVYEDSLKVYLLSNEVQFEGIREEYAEILQYYPMSERELTQGISNFSSLFNRERKKNEYNICGRNGKVGIRLDEFSSFEIPYYGIEDDCDENEKSSEVFYQGRNPLSWYGVRNGFAIDRVPQYRRICNEITASSKDNISKIIKLYHDPGAGGTTLSRIIAYNMSKTMPTVLLKSYNERITPMQLSNLYRKADMSVLVVVEKSLINDEDLRKLINELMAKAVPHVILHVCRTDRRKSSDDDLRYLTDSEFDEMQEKLDPFIDDDSKKTIKNLITRISDRYPFFMSMYAFEEEFKGVESYISHYLNDISSNDYNILSYISLVDKYANRSLDISFLRTNTDSELELFENDININLVSIEHIGHNSFVKMRHIRFAEEIIRARISSDSNDNMYRANNLSALIRGFIRYSKQNIMYDLDSTIEILKSLLILRDTNSLINDKFAPVIEELSKIIPDDVDENEKFNCIGLVFKELVSVYPEEAHFKAHLSRYYSHIEKNYDKGISEAKEAVKLSEEQGVHDALLYHIYGMSVRRYIERKLYLDAKDCYVFGEQRLFEEKMEEIQSCLSVASNQFKCVRGTNNKVAGYISDIEMCIGLIDFAKDVYSLNTEGFINKFKESWMMEYYDRALTLMEGFRAIQVEEDTEFYRVKLSTACNDSLQDMIYNIENTIELWERYLQHAKDDEKPVIRRFIARAKEKTIGMDTDAEKSNAKAVLALMEENIKQEPQNGANIRIWFNALRIAEGTNPDIELDEALQKLASWKQIGDNFEAYYYYFILVCIKAIEGSSRAEAIIPELQQELKAKTAHMPNNRVIYEWLGKGRGIGRLINSYELVNGKYRRRSIEAIERDALYVEGRITKYKSDRSAQIRAYNMEIFFAPTGQTNQASADDVNKKVEFIMGFSYDGLRAMNKSVHLVDYSKKEEDEDDDLIGKTVKCVVQKTDTAGFFVKVKMSDYRNSYGSIHSSELPEGKKVNDYSEGDIVWGKVIDSRYVEKEGRTYYQIRLREESQELEGWQKQLADIVKQLQ